MNLSKIQIDLLEHLLKAEYFESRSSAEGITKKIMAEKTTSNLSRNQEYVYKEKIAPLFTPKCDGVMRDSEYDTCNGNGEIDEDSLLISYMEDQMLCQICRYDLDKMNDN